MSDEFHHNHDDAVRMPKEMFAAVVKGRDPETNRAKTWVRVHTSKVGARKAADNWKKLNFGDVKLMSTKVVWEEIE